MDSHVIQFYEDEASYVNTVVRLVEPRLRTGAACVVFVTAPHREILETELTARGLIDRSAAASGNGRYQSFDLDAFLLNFMVDGWPDDQRFLYFAGAVVEQAAKRGNGRIWMVGDTANVLFDRGKPESAIRLEQLWNQLYLTHAFSLVCSYSTRVLDGAQHHHSRNACREHSGVCLP